MCASLDKLWVSLRAEYGGEGGEGGDQYQGGAEDNQNQQGGDRDMGVQEEKEEIKKVSRGVCLKVVEVEARPPPRP